MVKDHYYKKANHNEMKYFDIFNVFYQSFIEDINLKKTFVGGNGESANNFGIIALFSSKWF